MGDLDELLRSKRDQDAEDDDADFAGELAPAVQRLGQMEVHAAPFPLTRESGRCRTPVRIAPGDAITRPFRKSGTDD